MKVLKQLSATVIEEKNITRTVEANAHEQDMFRIAKKLFLTIVCAILFGTMSLFAQQMPKMDSATTTTMPATTKMDEELPHPFFTHMGMPEAMGVPIACVLLHWQPEWMVQQKVILLSTLKQAFQNLSGFT